MNRKRRFAGTSNTTSGNTTSSSSSVRYKYADEKKKVEKKSSEESKKTKPKRPKKPKKKKKEKSERKKKMPWDYARERAASQATTASKSTSKSTSKTTSKTTTSRSKPTTTRKEEENKVEEKEETAANWIETKSGKDTYYYHRITRDVRWERPPEHLIYKVDEEEMKVKARQEERVRQLREQARKREREEEDMRQLKLEVDHAVDKWAVGKELKDMIKNLKDILPHIDVKKIPKLKKRAQHAEIKRAYRKTMRLVHPDKQIGRTLRERLLAERVFSAFNAVSSEY